MNDKREPCPYCHGDLSDGRVHGRTFDDGPVECLHEYVPPPIQAGLQGQRNIGGIAQ